jgi:hypothetical protein
VSVLSAVVLLLQFFGFWMGLYTYHSSLISQFDLELELQLELELEFMIMLYEANPRSSEKEELTRLCKKCVLK